MKWIIYYILFTITSNLAIAANENDLSLEVKTYKMYLNFKQKTKRISFQNETFKEDIELKNCSLPAYKILENQIHEKFKSALIDKSNDAVEITLNEKTKKIFPSSPHAIFFKKLATKIFILKGHAKSLCQPKGKEK